MDCGHGDTMHISKASCPGFDAAELILRAAVGHMEPCWAPESMVAAGRPALSMLPPVQGGSELLHLTTSVQELVLPMGRMEWR